MNRMSCRAYPRRPFRTMPTPRVPRTGNLASFAPAFPRVTRLKVLLLKHIGVQHWLRFVDPNCHFAVEEASVTNGLWADPILQFSVNRMDEEFAAIVGRDVDLMSRLA